MELHFKSVLGRENKGDLTWLHPSGKQAISFDMVSGSDVSRGLDIVRLWLAEHHNENVFDALALIDSLHTLLANSNVQATFAVITRLDIGYQVYIIGNLRLYRISDSVMTLPEVVVTHQPSATLGQAGAVTYQSITLQPETNITYLLTSDGLEHQKLLSANLTSTSMKTGSIYQKLLPAVKDKDWSAIVFPMLEEQSFSSVDWPYDPFIGQQEERLHERRGLADIATALFQCSHFDGFRIVSCPPILSENSSRLFDGLLVYPFGAIPLELKDHHGDIQLDVATNKRQSMWVSNDMGQTSMANPVQKLRESLRRFGDISQLKALDAMLKNTGLVVFTSPSANVNCHYHGEVFPMPFTQAGEVLVSTTEQLVAALLKFCKSQFGKKLKPRLDEAEINALVDQLITEQVPKSVDRVVIGDYQCELTPITSESTDYYDIFGAWDFDDYLWVKRFTLDHLSAVNKQTEINSLGREAQILKRLARKNIAGVQRFEAKEDDDDNLYIFLQAAPSKTLTDYLAESPNRNAKIDLLIAIAQILQSIQSLGEPHIVHRAINPNNIRIDDNGQPRLINFELCQLDTVSTLPINARRTFEQKYQAPEVNEPGQSLTFAADIYSLGVIAFFSLAGKLPFDHSAKELVAKSRRRGFTQHLCSEMGIEGKHAEFVQRILHFSAQYRPDITQVMEMFHSWKE